MLRAFLDAVIKCMFTPFIGAALDDKSQYPLFARTIPNDEGTAVPLVIKLKEWGVKYLAVLHVDDAYGNAFAEG